MSVLIACLLLGLVLVGCEVFVPGGILGVLGAVVLLVAVVTAFKDYGLLGGTMTFIAVLVLLVTTLFLEFKILPKTHLGRRLFLSKKIDGQSYQISTNSTLIGKRAEALTVLAPSGKVKVEGRILEAISQDGFINKGTVLQIVGQNTFHLIVRKEQERPPEG